MIYLIKNCDIGAFQKNLENPSKKLVLVNLQGKKAGHTPFTILMTEVWQQTSEVTLKVSFLHINLLANVLFEMHITATYTNHTETEFVSYTGWF